MLGLSAAAKPRPAAATGPFDIPYDRREERRPDAAGVSSGPQQRPVEVSASEPQIRLEAMALDPVSTTPPEWLDSRLPPAPRSVDHRGTPPPIAPLLPPRLFASILVGLASAWRADGAVDVEALIDVIARQRPPTNVTRRLQPTLRLGVELFIDRADSMTPFDADTQQLIAACRRVLGSGIIVRWFEESPLLAGEGPRSEWTAYVPPTGGTPVIAVTDFGIVAGSPDVAAEWLEWAAQLSRVGCPAVGLVPWPRRRHPSELAAQIPMVPWDRSTTFRSLHDMTRRRIRS
jgi:hypothetical protein